MDISLRLKGDDSQARKPEKSQILDVFYASTGLSWSTARRYLSTPSPDRKKAWRSDKTAAGHQAPSEGSDKPGESQG